jgi:hypothetical protein
VKHGVCHQTTRPFLPALLQIARPPAAHCARRAQLQRPWLAHVVLKTISAVGADPRLHSASNPDLLVTPSSWPGRALPHGRALCFRAATALALRLRALIACAPIAEACHFS